MATLRDHSVLYRIATQLRRLLRCRMSFRVVASIAAILITATASLGAQISYPHFSSTTGMQLVGSAVGADSVIRLTGVGRMQSGAAWHRTKVRVADGFVTTFSFQFNQTGGRQDNTNANGGDGIAFVIQNNSEFARGGPGAGIGYTGLPNAIAIEFDTYLNDDVDILDPSANHVSLQYDANASHIVTVDSSSRIPMLDDGGVHTVIVEYIAGRMKVFIDNCFYPAIDTPFDIARNMPLDNGTAWVGFTAGTGDSWENHDILSWRLNQVVGTTERMFICEDDTLTLSAPGYYSRYEWSTGATTHSIRVARGGTYALTAYDTLGCEARVLTTTWDVQSVIRQRPQISPADTIWMCEGESITLDGQCCTSRRWSNGDTTRQITVRTPGLYWEVVVDEWGCRGWSDSVWVLFKPAPLPVIVADGPTEFCQGDSVTLTAGEHTRYKWSTGETTRSIVVRSSGQYSVEVFDSLGCRGSSAATVVLVPQRPRPVIRFLGPAALCAGAMTTLDAGPGYTRYRWSNGDTTQSIVVGTAGTYSVTVTSDRGCHGASQSVSVHVAPLPTPFIDVSGAMPVCHGDSIELSSRTSYTAYRWSNGDTTRSIVVDAGGSYTLTVVDSNGCEASTASTEVRFADLVDGSITAAGPLDICSGDSAVLRGPSGMLQYEWSNGASTQSITTTTPGRYHLRVTNENGCLASDTVEVTVGDRVVPIASADVTICRGASTPLSVASSVAVRWSPSDGLDCVDCGAPNARPLRTTTYYATTTGGSGCSGIDSTTVTVLPSASVTLTVSDGGVVYPGTIASVPVYLDGDLAEVGVDEMTLRVDYGSAMMLLVSLRPMGPFSTWTVETIEEIPGRFSVRLIAPPSASFTGSGHVFDLDFQTFLGDTLYSRIDASLAPADMPCVTVASQSGLLRADSMCGIGTRMIEAFGANLALEQNTPNPFNPTTEIAFSVPLDGPVQLSVHASDGSTVAMLVDEALAAGTHHIAWDAASAPSGLYVCRLTTGTWSRSIQMILVK